MASLSTYASRFLSLGANNNNDNSEYDDDSDPLFKSHLDDNNAASLSSSDGLPTLQSTTQHQSNKPNNNSNRPGSNSLAGMSRYSSYGAYGAYGGGNGGYSIYANQSNQRSSKKHGFNVGSSRMMGDSIREIDDDDDVDLWRNQRRMGGRMGLDDKHDSYDEDDDLDPSDHEQNDSSRRNRTSTNASTSSVTSDGNGNGNVDPFLAEDDLQRGESSRSKSRSKSKSSKSRKMKEKDLGQSELKKSKVRNQKLSKKGWLAHGDESSIISEEETTSTSNRNTVFDSTAEMENEAIKESTVDERGKAKYSLYEDESDGSGSETSRDELKSKSKFNSKNKGKSRAFDSHQDDATVSIDLSPNQSRTNSGRRDRRARASSTNSSTSTTSSQELDPRVGTKSIIRLDSYSLPPIPSGDGWAPWPWYLFKLPEFVRNALDDRVWERNRERVDEEWGDSNRNRSRRRETYEEEDDSGIKPPGWKEWNDRQAVIAFSLAITSVFVLGGAGGLKAKVSTYFDFVSLMFSFLETESLSLTNPRLFFSSQVDSPSSHDSFFASSFFDLSFAFSFHSSSILPDTAIFDSWLCSISPPKDAENSTSKNRS